MTTRNAISNRIAYDSLSNGDYVSLAPHLRHDSIRRLYADLVERAYKTALLRAGGPVSVLDLGAGEGTVTLPFLQLGARVLAVDISERQLEQLRTKCAGLSSQLEVRCETLMLFLLRINASTSSSPIHCCTIFLTISSWCGVLRHG